MGNDVNNDVIKLLDFTSYLYHNLNIPHFKFANGSLLGSVSIGFMKTSELMNILLWLEQNNVGFAYVIDSYERDCFVQVRIAEGQQQKTAPEDMKPEQLEKLAKLESWRQELKLLEGKKAEHAASWMETCSLGNKLCSFLFIFLWSCKLCVL